MVPASTSAFKNILYQDDDYATIFSNSLIINSNSTHANNVSIQFGNSLTQSLTWDATNSRFVLNDSLRIEGDQSVIGRTFIADDHVASDSDGVINLGREGGNWNTLRWDGLANSFSFSNSLDVDGGLTVSGNADFSSSSAFNLREIDSFPAACTSLREIVLNRADNKVYVCTAIGNPGTWVTSITATPDFEDVYGADADKTLTTSNGPFTIDTGTGNFIVDSNSWNVTAGGALDAGTVTSNGLLTGLGGANISGSTVNLNFNTNFPVNIGTGTSTGQVSLGGGNNCVSVDSYSWDMSCAGAVSGLTGVTSTGSINFGAANNFFIPQYADDPLTCTPGEQYYNTITATVRLCTEANIWTGGAPSGTQYAFVYDINIQAVTVPNTFQNVTFSSIGYIDGWGFTPGGSTFVATVDGTFMSNIVSRVAKNGGANTTLSMRMTINGVEVPGSQSYGSAIAASGDTMSGNFIFMVSTGDIVSIQMTGGTTGAQIQPGGSGTTQPSIQFNIWRMQ